MDTQRLKNMITDAKQRSGGGNDLIWKPKPGLNTIRAVPYIHDPEMPFRELRIHYQEISRTPILSPTTPTIGKPDPILKFGLRLQEEADGDKETWVRGKKLEPKSRYFLPILVRGEEDQGVKFWGFGVTIFENLYSKVTNPKWGDFTDPTNGRDIDITYTKPTPQNKYGSKVVDLSPERSPITNDKKILELIQDMPKVEELYKLHTYEELENILEQYIKQGSANVGSTYTTQDERDDNKSEKKAVEQRYEPVSSSTTESDDDDDGESNEGDLKSAFNEMFKKKG